MLYQLSYSRVWTPRSALKPVGSQEVPPRQRPSRALHAGGGLRYGSGVSELERRIAEGVAALRARFGEKVRATPSLTDAAPLGSGEPNRHGMPKVPTGQAVTKRQKWPVLDLGDTPSIAPEKWRLEVDGAVGSPLALSFADLMALPPVEVDVDFHSVTGW